MLQWYRRLLRLRRDVPALTQGKTVFEQARDEEGLVIITKELEGQKVTLVFRGKEGETDLPELAGKTDMITCKPFDGNVTGITAMVLHD